MSIKEPKPKYPLCTRCGKPITPKHNPKEYLISIHPHCLEANTKARKQVFRKCALRYRGAKK